MICKSCQTTFEGKYCHTCGEKIIEDKDFHLSSIFSSALGSITNLDSKLYRSLRSFFLRPGELSEKFIRGERKNYVKPFQIFIVANILFFLFLNDIDLFRTPSKWYFQEHFDDFPVLEKVNSIIQERSITMEEVAIMYDTKSTNIAKGFLILIIPLIALVGMLLNLKAKMAYGKHVIFAAHYFAFVLIFAVLWTSIMYLVPFQLNKWYFIIPISLAMLVYYILAAKRYYNLSWIASIWKGMLGYVLIILCIQIYRIFVNLISLHTI